MFGLNDTKDQPQDIDKVTPFPQAMAMDDKNTPAPAPPLNPAAATNPVPAPPNPAPAVAMHNSGLMLPSTDASGKNSNLNLQNAYIPADAPQTDSGDSAAKPVAASLMTNVPHDDLLKIKQQALTNLAPLVDHLEQTPEEKFKTTMMLIQASDNAELIPEAYEAANQIRDEKDRAQALLDVVNEINYFTQHGINVPGQTPSNA
jgi:hypothetical protein